MHSSEVERALLTIQHNIVLARQFIGELSMEDFAEDERTLYAVTRCLEIISEASRRLPPALTGNHTEVPWRQIAGAGNVYRHDYEDVMASILWHTVHESLSVLDHAVSLELGHSRSS